ncbi:MAG: heme exporter protein CcmD [Rhodobacteraceae bacterium]|nr:heme exporter protein CcmD [Paracoccaceae bacterium]
MLDLGKYAAPILLSYGMTFILIFGLTILSLWQSKIASRRLKNLKKN